jgi:hypothetical protein
VYGMIGRAQAFLDLIRAGAPEIYREFESLLGLPDSEWSEDRLNAIYQRVATADFSKLVLSTRPERLGVWCLGDVGWSDLGDPRRVMTVMAETGATYEWAASWRNLTIAAAAGQ